MTTSSFIPSSLISLLNQERGLGPVRQMDDLQARLQRRGMIMQQLRQLEEAVRDAQRQLRTLPQLPPLKCIQWAQAIQSLPNLVFLEVDTTGLYEDAEIIRLVVMSIRGNILLDRLVTPSRPISRQIATITGIEQGELQVAGIPITDALAQLRQAIRGTYLLSYNLEFDECKLREAVQRHQLDDITIIGEDLMTRAMSYLQLSSYPKLEHLCKQIGQPLPPQPLQTALDRAHGQIAVLYAMANAALTAPGTPIVQSSDTDDDDERDEHPF
ncbi:3'-5' exonuclease [Dictyobacter aurantiacus]|uniref:Exonuclease domain-containing protein n=1 Tax=Dictyobacter aurantiacus TaxID=1936993 RepID=A0A401ZBE1_9CHLR|nr:3'-5' exonuclease [Dictyobacter aurantiacus]GCE04231.1 hypothetical protein KDAU_15600 [Dictyobacter aurantiacus]